ncbi:MAG: DUF6596 domain-containing protein [Solirubrobacterales bacterium]
MLLTDARRATRVDASGELAPLEEQDRTKWEAEPGGRAQPAGGRGDGGGPQTGPRADQRDR